MLPEHLNMPMMIGEFISWAKNLVNRKEIAIYASKP
jgi:hypothetical protein